MKVLFITVLEDLGFEEPLGIEYLAGYLALHGHCSFISSAIETRLLARIEEVAPDVLAFSALTPNFAQLLAVCCKAKRKHAHIISVFGGPHATFFPDIVQHLEIDYIIRGEGEIAFVELLDALEKGRSPYHISNLGYQNPSGETKINPVRPLVQDLDTLPFPDREILYTHNAFYKSDVRSVMASRGCPNHCSYCYNNKYHELYKGLGKRVRIRSVDNVIHECRELRDRYDAKMIHFFDDIFPFESSWIKEFSRRYPLEVGLPFITNTSFNVCSDTYISNLAKSGCKTLLIGVETGNEYFREHILLRKMKNRDMISAAKRIHQYGIKIYTQNLIGLPYGSLELDLETLRLNIILRADYAGAYLTQPYPGTRIEEIARNGGFIDTNKSLHFEKSFYYASPMKIHEKDKIEKLRILFPIVVNHPWLMTLIYLLLELPTSLFKWYGMMLHGLKIKNTILRYPMSFQKLGYYIWMFFKRPINRIYTLRDQGKQK